MTRFTSRSGTTITFLGTAPPSARRIFSWPSASASACSRGQALGGGDRIAQLAVDLEREGDGIVDQQRGVGVGPGRVGDEAGLRETRPAFLGHVGDDRGGEL